MGLKEHEKLLFTMCWIFRDNWYPRDVYNCLRNIIPYKQYRYYLNKWDSLGFRDWGVSQDLGWFYPEKFPERYREIIEDIGDFKATIGSPMGKKTKKI